MDDRMITTSMSSKIIAALMKKGWTIRRLAKVLDASGNFIEGVRAREHVLTVKDIETLAEAAGQSANMMILNSLEPAKPEFRSLIQSTKSLIRVCEEPLPGRQRKPSKGRRSRSRAA